MPINNSPIDDINSNVNTVAGIKQYQQIKKAMEEFDSKLKSEINKQSAKIDHQIK